VSRDSFIILEDIFPTIYYAIFVGADLSFYSSMSLIYCNRFCTNIFCF